MAEIIENPLLTEAKARAEELILLAEQADVLITQLRPILADLAAKEQAVRSAMINFAPATVFAKAGQSGIMNTAAEVVADANKTIVVADLARAAWSDLLEDWI